MCARAGSSRENRARYSYSYQRLRYLWRDIHSNAIPLTFLDDPVDTPSDGSHLSEEDEGQRPRWHLRHPSVLGALARQPCPNHLPKPQTQAETKYNTAARKGKGRGERERRKTKGKGGGRGQENEKEDKWKGKEERNGRERGEGIRNIREQEGGRGRERGKERGKRKKKGRITLRATGRENKMTENNKAERKTKEKRKDKANG